MTKRIFITATNTDIGKTFTTERLLKTYAQMGLRVGAFKPIETGVNTIPPDGTRLLETVKALNPDFNATIGEVVPVQFTLPAAPFVANGGEPIDLGPMDEALAKIETMCDVVLIEGAGGLMVPIDKNRMMIDLITHFKAPTLLVSHCSLGCINDTLLSLQTLRHYNISHAWALNCKTNIDTFVHISESYFEYAYGRYFEVSRDTEPLARHLLTL